jgi:hypothetical protein
MFRIFSKSIGVASADIKKTNLEEKVNKSPNIQIPRDSSPSITHFSSLMVVHLINDPQATQCGLRNLK